MHTSKLKRKLNDLGIDTASAKANENFCLIGTPLPALEKSKDAGEFVPLWKQEVRDEKGRRRLHGAFTGGFSAGYFNSVGSKEGWTPSTFVSSRSDRAKQKGARKEDFMDEEDLADIRESRELVDEHEEMDLTGGTEAELRQRAGTGELEMDSMAFKLEEALLPPPKDSVGAKILKKMGWRPGHGVGPRVTWRQRKLQDLQAAGRPSALNPPDLKEEEDEEAAKHMYPPRDTPLLLPPRKEDNHGLGYVPGPRLSESVGGQSNDKQRGPKLSSGFGLGALNEAEDDDVDIYDTDTRSGRSRMAFDITDADHDGNADNKQRRATKAGAKTDTRPQTSRQFHDGTPVLPEFVIVDEPLLEDRWYPLPEVPKGWKPDPRSIWEKDKENIDKKEKGFPKATSHAQWKMGPTPEQRGAILGETLLPSAPRSVFEYMSQKDRERLKNVTTKLPSEPPVKTEDQPRAESSTRLEPHIAKAALQGFQPFTADPVKQARYTTYLRSQAEPDTSLPQLTTLPGQSPRDLTKEMQDYAKSARVFKPLSAAMAGRFTSASILDLGPKITEGLHTPSFDPEKEAKSEDYKEEEKKEAEVEESPKAHAARLGMYGPLTREVTPWLPARLLCKRFGVKEPESAPVPETEASAAASTSKSKWTPQAAMADATGSNAQTTADGTYVPAAAAGGSSDDQAGGIKSLDNVGLGEDETQGVDILTYERPPMDVFKAIFASDDEDSDDEEGKGGNAKEEEMDVDMDMHVASAPSADVHTAEEKSVPGHLALTSATVQYEPKASGSASVVQQNIDLATFKPTFIPRSDRESADKKSKGKGKEKERKEKKKSSKAGTLVSFEVEEDGYNVPVPPKDKDRERAKKKKRKERKGGAENEDDSMWVEKPAPEAVKAFDHAVPPAMADHSNDVDDSETIPSRGRKRAIDFM